jgi:hypothetical protein
VTADAEPVLTKKLTNESETSWGTRATAHAGGVSYRHSCPTRASARSAIFEYIEGLAIACHFYARAAASSMHLHTYTSAARAQRLFQPGGRGRVRRTWAGTTPRFPARGVELAGTMPDPSVPNAALGRWWWR